MNRPSKINWLSPYVSMEYAYFYKYNASDPDDNCTQANETTYPALTWQNYTKDTMLYVGD